MLFDAVTGMKRRFPELDVQLLTDSSPRLQERVDDGPLDVAMLILPSGAALPAGLSGSRVARFDVKVVQSADQPLVARRTDMHALAAHGWILNPDGCGYRAALERAMTDQGQVVRLSINTYVTDMQLRLVASRLGLVPIDVLRASKWQRKLSAVELPGDRCLAGPSTLSGKSPAGRRGASRIDRGVVRRAVGAQCERRRVEARGAPPFQARNVIKLAGGGSRRCRNRSPGVTHLSLDECTTTSDLAIAYRATGSSAATERLVALCQEPALGALAE